MAISFHLLVTIYLFGVLHRFQHCTGHITTGSWKGRGNQYIEFARVVYCKLLTNGKQLPAFPLEPVRGSNPGLRGGRRECYHSATVAPPCYYTKLQGCCGQTERQSFELVCPTLDMKSQIFPGLFLYWYMEVGILEKYRGNPLPLLERGSDGFQCLQFFFFMFIS